MSSSNTKVQQAFASMISQAFSRFRANLQIWFHSVFAIHGFANFRKDSQGIANGLSQPFAKDSQVENHGFSQGFTMGTLLMTSTPRQQSSPAL